MSTRSLYHHITINVINATYQLLLRLAFCHSQCIARATKGKWKVQEKGK